MGNGIRGLPHDRTSDAATSIQMGYATVVAKGYGRRGLDTISGGLYQVASDAAEAGSTTSVINATGHSAFPGDIIRILTVAAGDVYEKEIGVKSVTANTITLDGKLSAALAAGDTFLIMRSITATYDSGGGLIASQAFLLDGVLTTVVKDTVNPANNIPLPVEICGTSGTVSINATNLNLEVQTSHVGATYDSMRIGDGTTLLAIEAGTGKAKVKDEGAIALLTTIDADTGNIATSVGNIDTKLPAALGQGTMAQSLSVVLASNQSAVNVGNISGTVSLPTGAATSALQTTLNSTVATAANQTSLSAKFGSLGQKAMAGSAPVVLASDQAAIPISTISGAITLPTGASTAALQTTLNSTVATETTLAAMSAKLPASLGVKSAANSLSVVSAGLNVLAFAQHSFASTNVTDAAYVELNADIGGTAGRKITVFMSQGEPIYLAVGASGSEANIAIIHPGGWDYPIELNIPANARLSMKAVNGTTTINSGVLIYHVMG